MGSTGASLLKILRNETACYARGLTRSARRTIAEKAQRLAAEAAASPQKRPPVRWTGRAFASTHASTQAAKNPHFMGVSGAEPDHRHGRLLRTRRRRPRSRPPAAAPEGTRA